MYLLDTNIILELLLDQDKSDEVERFLRDIPPEQLYLSEVKLLCARPEPMPCSACGVGVSC
jgi:predicted nucleic acid-binding protein